MATSNDPVMPVTLWATPNEKALALTETNQVVPSPEGGTAWHRIQSIFVVRGDAPAEWRTDLGPTANYKASQFRVPSYLEHTVAELQDIAEHLRSDTDRLAEKVISEEREAAAERLPGQFQDHMEAKNEAARRRSQFGPKHNKQRNR